MMKRQRPYRQKSPYAKRPKMYHQYNPDVVVPYAARAMALKKKRSSQYYRSRNIRTAGLLGVEKKFYDTAKGSTAISTDYTMQGAEMDPSATSMISTPAQGDDASSRDGKQIVMDYVTIIGSVSIAPLETTVDPPGSIQVYLALVLDTQTNGAQMNSEDCFKNTNGAIATICCPQRNLLYGSRFKVLHEETVEMSTPTLTQNATNEFSTAGHSHLFKWFIPLKAMKVNFNAGTTASVANVVDNSLHIIAYANNATLQPYLAYNARLRFYG